MRALFERKISIALPTMLAIQSFGTICSFAGAVVAVQAAVDLGVKSTSIGIYTAVIYVAGMLSGLSAGSFLARYGVIRTCQVALLLGVLGLGLASALPFWPVAIGAAVLLGMGTGPLNPAGSRILARHAPPQWQPFVFSVKQTGTPLGGMLAGLLLPPLMVLYDWRVAVVAISAIPLVTLFGLQLIRSDLDDDRDPAFRISFTGILTSLRLILTSKPLVTLATAGYLYTFAQMSILSFMVIYLVETNGLSAGFAGGIFAIIHGSAIPARRVGKPGFGVYLVNPFFTALKAPVMICSGVEKSGSPISKCITFSRVEASAIISRIADRGILNARSAAALLFMQIPYKRLGVLKLN